MWVVGRGLFTAALGLRVLCCGYRQSGAWVALWKGGWDWASVFVGSLTLLIEMKGHVGGGFTGSGGFWASDTRLKLKPVYVSLTYPQICYVQDRLLEDGLSYRGYSTAMGW